MRSMRLYPGWRGVLKRGARLGLATCLGLALAASVAAESGGEDLHVFRVTGMTCGMCAKAIEKIVTGVEGVERVSIDRKGERVEIAAGPEVSVATLEQAIESAGGYEAELLQGLPQP